MKKFAIISACFYIVERIPLPNPNSDNQIDRVDSEIKTENRYDCLILLWNEYQVLGKDIYKKIFKRINDNECPVSNCKFIVDRSLQNQSSAIIFHMPNLHWENYTYPEYRRPEQNWILMTYESATNVRQRSSNWGKYPPINWHRINGMFNRTMTFREDSDVVVRHGFIEKRKEPLSDEEMAKIYSNVRQG